MAWLRMWRTHRSNTCLSLASAFTLLLKYVDDDPVWRAFRFSERHDRLELIRHVTAHAIVLDAVEPHAAVYPGCDVTWELLVQVGIITLLGHGKRCTRRGQSVKGGCHLLWLASVACQLSSAYTGILQGNIGAYPCSSGNNGAVDPVLIHVSTG
jgi:hypothetical protein